MIVLLHFHWESAAFYEIKRRLAPEKQCARKTVES